MLYSASQNLGFVHYPKTAGHSVASWFKRSFPDAIYLDPPTEHKVSHLSVIPSLSLLGARNAEILPTLSIIGVMRNRMSEPHILKPTRSEAESFPTKGGSLLAKNNMLGTISRERW